MSELIMLVKQEKNLAFATKLQILFMKMTKRLNVLTLLYSEEGGFKRDPSLLANKEVTRLGIS